MSRFFNKVGDVICHPRLGKRVWVVIKAERGGGSDIRDRDWYPDGHEITCLPINGLKIDHRVKPKIFYQSGCFQNLLEYVKPIETLKIWCPPRLYLAKRISKDEEENKDL